MVIVFLLLTISGVAEGQISGGAEGQASAWINVNSGNLLPLWGGIRYIPQGNISFSLPDSRSIEAEISANISGMAGSDPFDTISTTGRLKPYRVWARYSTDRFEIRAGLQKVNFGSSTMLRPLMWFDQLDARDPLQLTDGVISVLSRYYFLNNTNIWLWVLYGNKSARGWDIIPSNSDVPELGGRIQLPFAGGEAALSYHHRVADSRQTGGTVIPLEKIPEDRIGFDARWDLKAGIWIEGSYIRRHRDVGILSSQAVVTAGTDYTFSAGNGIYLAAEQLLVSFQGYSASDTENALFSAININYPAGIFDRIGGIFYFDWKGGNIYSFLTWNRQYDNFGLYLMAFWNPDNATLPIQSGGQNIFAGKGLQMMFVFNH